MKDLLIYLKSYRKESMVAPLFKLLEACFELIVPAVMAKIIDIGIQNGDTAYILRMGLLLILFGLVGLLCSATAQYFAAKAAYGFGTALRKDFFRHVNRLSFAELDLSLIHISLEKIIVAQKAQKIKKQIVKVSSLFRIICPIPKLAFPVVSVRDILRYNRTIILEVQRRVRHVHLSASHIFAGDLRRTDL